MKIGFLFNCQGQGIAAALEKMLPGCTAFSYHAHWAQVSLTTRAEYHAALMGCDHIVTAPMAVDMGPLSTARLRRNFKNLHILPPLNFRGFHPDTIYIKQEHGSVTGLTGDYQSRIAVAGFLAGLPAEEVAALYNAVVFARLGYFRAYNEDFALMPDRFAQFDIDAAPMVAHLQLQGCFMHSWNHPKSSALVEMARLVCGMIGEKPEEPRLDEIPDFLERQPIHPVFPEIAAVAGIPPEGMFRGGIAPGAPPLPITNLNFVRGSFEVFAALDPEVLRRGDGVQAALDVLGLQNRRSLPPSAEPDEASPLMTWHGTLLRAPIAAAPGPIDTAVPHLPLSVDEKAAPLLRLNTGTRGQAAACAALPDVEVVPSLRAGLVCLHRNGVYLGADGASARAMFLRDAPGDCEIFLPVPPGALEALRLLLRETWCHDVPGDAPDLPQPRLAPGPIVEIGPARIDLRQRWPRLLPDAESGARRMAVLLDGAAITLRSAPPAKQAQSAPPPPPQLPLGKVLLVNGAPAWLHPPLTVRNADRLWVQVSSGDGQGLAWRVETPGLTLRREAARMAGEGAWMDGEPVAAPPGHGLAALAGPCILLEAPDLAPDMAKDPLGWVAALMRLLAIVPYLPPGSAVLRPRDDETATRVAEGWLTLGLPPLAMAALPAPTAVADELIWCDPMPPWNWPAEILRAVRFRLAGTAPGSTRVYLQGGAPIAGAAAFSRAIAKLGWTTLDLASESPANVLATLKQAGWVLGSGTRLLAAAFCPPQTRVLELSSDRAFRPEIWRLCNGLGLTHGVLPCPESDLGLEVDQERLVALMRVLGFRLLSG